MPEFKNFDEIMEYIDNVIRDERFSEKFFEEYGKYFSEKQINEIMDRIYRSGSYFYFEHLYKYAGKNFTPENIDKAIEKGKALDILYYHVGENFTIENIEKAIEKKVDVYALYESIGYKFTPELIDKAIEIGWYLDDLFKYLGDKFTDEQIDRVIDIGKVIEVDWYLEAFFNYMGDRITDRQINKIINNAIESGRSFGVLFKYVGNKITDEQIDKAVWKVVRHGDYKTLVNFYNASKDRLTEEQKKALLERKRYLEYLKVIKDYPEVEYFEEKTYKVDRFIDVLKVIYRDMIES